MFPVEWEGVTEEEVRAFLEWDSSKSIKPAFVALLEFLGEGFISSEGSVGHFTDYTQR